MPRSIRESLQSQPLSGLVLDPFCFANSSPTVVPARRHKESPANAGLSHSKGSTDSDALFATAILLTLPSWLVLLCRRLLLVRPALTAGRTLVLLRWGLLARAALTAGRRLVGTL